MNEPNGTQIMVASKTWRTSKVARLVKRGMLFFLAEAAMSNALVLRAELTYPSFKTVFVREAIRVIENR